MNAPRLSIDRFTVHSVPQKRLIGAGTSSHSTVAASRRVDGVSEWPLQFWLSYPAAKVAAVKLCQETIKRLFFCCRFEAS
jgi:hypothetical protein